MPIKADHDREKRSMRKRNPRLRVIGAAFLLLYVGAYLGLSGRGYAESHRWNACGFYYLSPEDSDRWRFWNYACLYLFHPLNVADQCLGTGMEPACEPLWGFSTSSSPATTGDGDDD
jgi:hypothetical protein